MSVLQPAPSAICPIKSCGEGLRENMKKDTSTGSQLCIIQFQHPRNEIGVCNQDTKCKDIFLVPWNSKEHRRRLVQHSGKFVMEGVDDEGSLAFWTEWEADTKAKNLKPMGNNMLAKRIHFPLPLKHMVNQNHDSQGCVRVTSPHCAISACGNFLNTDPCVFGRSFKYSNCRQNATTRLKHLMPGSLIVFGSVLNGQYCLDTVFIVADNPTPFRTSNTGIKSVICTDEYRILTLERLVSNNPVDYVFYRGVTFQKGMTTPFSFTPSYRFKSDNYENEVNSYECRKRCIIDLDKLNSAACKVGGIKPFDIKQTRRATLTLANRVSIKAVWDNIVQQVQDKRGNNMVLGVRFNWPEK